MTICVICGAAGTRRGFLFRCGSQECLAVQWNRAVVSLLSERLEDKRYLNAFLRKAGVVRSINKHDYVYVLRLDDIDGKEAVYVGRTGLHPYARYLDHLRGSNASRVAKNRAIALIHFDGPMSRKESEDGEKATAKEWEQSGWKVYGGH